MPVRNLPGKVKGHYVEDINSIREREYPVLSGLFTPHRKNGRKRC